MQTLKGRVIHFGSNRELMTVENQYGLMDEEPPRVADRKLRASRFSRIRCVRPVDIDKHMSVLKRAGSEDQIGWHRASTNLRPFEISKRTGFFVFD